MKLQELNTNKMKVMGVSRLIAKIVSSHGLIGIVPIQEMLLKWRTHVDTTLDEKPN